MNNYYSEAKKNETNKVWDKFEQQEKSDVGTSKNYESVSDAKKSYIGITVNTTKDIEDKYYGEGLKTFDNDSKYFHPSGGNVKSEDWLPFILAAAAVIIIPPFFM